MRMLKKYRFGFDIRALLLFLAIMIPNFIWFAVPAPNDILRADSITESLDMVASIFQTLTIGSLCVLVNRECKKIGITPFIAGVFLCCLLYFVSWAAYYLGMTNAVVVLGLTIPPCLAFLLFAIDRKNGIAVISAAIFAVCHLVYGAVNFII